MIGFPVCSLEPGMAKEPDLESRSRTPVDEEEANPIARPPCPHCGRADAVIPIVYGYPSDEMFRADASGKIVLGGCIVAPDSPHWRCSNCGTEFRGPSGSGSPRIEGLAAFRVVRPKGGESAGLLRR